MPSDILGPATLSVSQGISAFQFFLPKLSEVRKANSAVDLDMVGDVRLGEVAAVTLCIGVGAIVSSLSGSPVPAFVSALMAAILVCIYETALRADRPMEPKSGLRSSER